MSLRTFPIALALLAATAACSYRTPPPQSVAAAPPAAAAAGEAAAGDPAGLIVGNLRLSSDGLAAGMPGLHTNQSFRFGMSKAEIVAAVAQMRSWETPRETNGQCGAGPMEFTRFGTLTLNSRNGRFVGWSLDGPLGAEPIEEEYGLGIGIPRAEVFSMDSEEVRFETTARGVEFDASGIHGRLSSNAPDAVVTHLWAGTSCQLR